MFLILLVDDLGNWTVLAVNVKIDKQLALIRLLILGSLKIELIHVSILEHHTTKRLTVEVDVDKRLLRLIGFNDLEFLLEALQLSIVSFLRSFGGIIDSGAALFFSLKKCSGLFLLFTSSLDLSFALLLESLGGEGLGSCLTLGLEFSCVKLVLSELLEGVRLVIIASLLLFFTLFLVLKSVLLHEIVALFSVRSEDTLPFFALLRQELLLLDLFFLGEALLLLFLITVLLDSLGDCVSLFLHECRVILLLVHVVGCLRVDFLDLVSNLGEDFMTRFDSGLFFLSEAARGLSSVFPVLAAILDIRSGQSELRGEEGDISFLVSRLCLLLLLLRLRFLRRFLLRWLGLLFGLLLFFGLLLLFGLGLLFRLGLRFLFRFTRSRRGFRGLLSRLVGGGLVVRFVFLLVLLLAIFFLILFLGITLLLLVVLLLVVLLIILFVFLVVFFVGFFVLGVDLLILVRFHLLGLALLVLEVLLRLALIFRKLADLVIFNLDLLCERPLTRVILLIIVVVVTMLSGAAVVSAVLAAMFAVEVKVHIVIITVLGGLGEGAIVVVAGDDHLSVLCWLGCFPLLELALRSDLLLGERVASTGASGLGGGLGTLDVGDVGCEVLDLTNGSGHGGILSWRCVLLASLGHRNFVLHNLNGRLDVRSTILAGHFDIFLGGLVCLLESLIKILELLDLFLLVLEFLDQISMLGVVVLVFLLSARLRSWGGDRGTNSQTILFRAALCCGKVGDALELILKLFA